MRQGIPREVSNDLPDIPNLGPTLSATGPVTAIMLHIPFRIGLAKRTRQPIASSEFILREYGRHLHHFTPIHARAYMKNGYSLGTCDGVLGSDSGCQARLLLVEFHELVNTPSNCKRYPLSRFFRFVWEPRPCPVSGKGSLDGEVSRNFLIW